MKILLHLRSTTRIGLMFILATASAAAADYCSLTVQVSDGHGNSASGVSVRLAESNGRLENGITKDGKAKFCDLGSSNVTLTIGGVDHCNELVIHNLSMSWGVEKIVNAIYSRDYCNEDEIALVGCVFLLRFVSEVGTSVPNVRFDAPIGIGQIERSDSFGRALVQAKQGQVLVGTALATGYRSEKMELQCRHTTSKEERFVTLHHIN